MKLLIKVGIITLLFLFPTFCRAMPPGTLLYRTSGDGKMFGYSGDPLIYAEKGIVKNTYSGHAAIYIGKENGVDYVVETLGGGIVKNPAKYFVNRAENETFLGAKIPRDVNPLQQAKVVALAKNLASRSLGYDFDFKSQKGPNSGQWTCVGLTEKLYESANVSNPNNLGSLEYDSNYYAVDITPDGYDNYSVINSSGDCFSRDKEFSKIARRKDLIVPPPEIFGYDVGLEYEGERYVFLPYTQFLQPTLEPVAADIEISSSFSGVNVRGAISAKALVLRWSLINNPLSSLRNIASTIKDLAVKAVDKTKTLVKGFSQKVLGAENETKIVLDNKELKKIATTTAKKTASVKKTTVKKAAAKKTATKTTVEAKKQTKKVTTTVKSATVKKTAVKTEKETIEKSVEPTVKTTVASSVKSAAKKVSETKTTSPAPVAPVYYSPVIYTNPVSSNNSSTAADNWPKLALINKIYATGNNDWIELFNSGDHDFDLAAAGYRLEKTKTAEDPSLIMRLGNLDDGSYPGGTVIKAHDSYLIVSTEADSYYKNQADAIARREGFNWSGSGYTLYLGTGVIGASTDPDIVDAVGIGPEATYFQGTGPTLELNDNYFLNRIARGENNRSDFNLVPAGDPAAIAARAALAASSTEPAATSTIETTTEENIATSSDDTATSTDDQIINHPDLALISKIYASGDNDWLELFNPGDYDFDLASSTYRLEKTKTAEDPSLIMRIGNLEDGIYPGGTIIKAHGKYLIVRDEASSYYKNQADAIGMRDEFGWTGSGYTLYLGKEAISSSTDSNIINTVGFGSEATYFQGSGPALEITDGYFLNRIASNNDNHLDFNLLRSDDPAYATSSDLVDDKLDLYVLAQPLISPGLNNLWHFDECYGEGDLAVGKWDCAKKIVPEVSSFMTPLNVTVDLNSFSLSFYYRKTMNYPRLEVRLNNSEQEAVSLTLEPGLITVEGLPNSKWRYYLDMPFDDTWHKANLVINQAEDYWAVYIDGQEKIREGFFARLDLMTELKVNGNCGVVSIDEIAMWNRSLSSGEVLSDYLADRPYSPLAERGEQKPAELIHFWDFAEDDGSLAVDSVGQAVLSVWPELWVGRKHNNYAIKISQGKDFLADFEEPLDSRDLSLTFWWRNSSYPDIGRVGIYLNKSGDTRNFFALIFDHFRRGYWYNGSDGILSEGVDTDVLNDDAWHHIALVYDSYRYLLRLYVDGLEKANRPLIWIQPEDRVDQLKVLTDTYSSEIDDLGVYEGALSPAQIEEIYNLTK